MAKVRRRSKAKRRSSLRDRAAREAWWRGCVQEWERSGESQAGFARRKGVAYATFNWWKLRILKPRRGPARVRGGGHKGVRAGQEGRGRAGRTRPVLLPVEVKPAVAAASWSVEIECRNGRVLRLRDLLDAGALSALVGALEAERRC